MTVFQQRSLAVSDWLPADQAHMGSALTSLVVHLVDQALQEARTSLHPDPGITSASHTITWYESGWLVVVLVIFQYPKAES